MTKRLIKLRTSIFSLKGGALRLLCGPCELPASPPLHFGAIRKPNQGDWNMSPVIPGRWTAQTTATWLTRREQVRRGDAGPTRFQHAESREQFKTSVFSSEIFHLIFPAPRWPRVTSRWPRVTSRWPRVTETAESEANGGWERSGPLSVFPRVQPPRTASRSVCVKSVQCTQKRFWEMLA